MANGFNNFVQLMNAVFTETARPDLIAETAQAVFSSTMKCHTLDYFRKDIRATQLVFDAAAYIQSIDVQDLPFYRAISYIRKDDPSLYGPYETNPTNLPPLYTSIDGQVFGMNIARRILTEVDPDDIFDEFGAERVDIWYQAGATLFLRSSTAVRFGLLGYYQFPNLDVGNANLGSFLNAPSNCSPLFNSWIANDFPYAIIYDAASSVLQKIGQTDAARKYDQLPDPRTGRGAGLVWSHIQNLIQSNITSTGR